MLTHRTLAASIDAQLQSRPEVVRQSILEAADGFLAVKEVFSNHAKNPERALWSAAGLLMEMPDEIKNYLFDPRLHANNVRNLSRLGVDIDRLDHDTVIRALAICTVLSRQTFYRHAIAQLIAELMHCTQDIAEHCACYRTHYGYDLDLELRLPHQDPFQRDITVPFTVPILCKEILDLSLPITVIERYRDGR